MLGASTLMTGRIDSGAPGMYSPRMNWQGRDKVAAYGASAEEGDTEEGTSDKIRWNGGGYEEGDHGVDSGWAFVEIVLLGNGGVVVERKKLWCKVPDGYVYGNHFVDDDGKGNIWVEFTFNKI